MRIILILLVLAASIQLLICYSEITPSEYEYIIRNRLDQASSVISEYGNYIGKMDSVMSRNSLDSMKIWITGFKEEISALRIPEQGENLSESALQVLDFMLDIIATDLPELYQDIQLNRLEQQKGLNSVVSSPSFPDSLSRLIVHYQKNSEEFSEFHDFFIPEIDQAEAIDEEQARNLIAEIMQLMLQGQGEMIRNYLYPGWLENNIGAADLKINIFSGFYHEIEELRLDNGLIKVKLNWDKNDIRVILWFRIINIDDDLFIYPGGLRGKSIDPWYYRIMGT
ncbi:MAG: hypothetical protein JW996_04130 [Candidatus Cloacimonetes bacterium]|nr:hypothetical protein [Candidatus Cloacimonadota bacterium]